MPDKIKILEALGAIADGRLKIDGGNQSATCLSSDKTKQYMVRYDLKHSAITSNDNSAHWQGRLGYPAIAVLMELGELKKEDKIAESIKDIPWRELNQKFNNEYDKTLQVVYQVAKSADVSEHEINQYMEEVMKEIESRKFNLLKN